ncbi:MAG: class IV adenylate cyclase [Bacteroidota bacterium]
MKATIIEIKARCAEPEKIRRILEGLDADFKGIDHQVDTYFKVPKGRLKLREGNIENTLIQYHRHNQAGPKKSEVSFFRTKAGTALGDVLGHALDILTKVDKQRAIYFVDNVKFHIDEVVGLGSFMEIEAIDETGVRTEAQLLEQCQYYQIFFAYAK